jgi:D-alanyl-D-alanine carboxypeptidase
MAMTTPTLRVSLLLSSLLLNSLLLSACGGGGSSSTTAPPAVVVQTNTSTSTSTPVFHAPYSVASVGQDLSLFPLSAQNIANQVQAAQPAIDQAVQSLLTRGNIPGAAVVVLQDGKIAYAKSYGYANLEQRSVLHPEQRFFLGSISKQFTAASVMMLVEEGKIALDEKVSRYVGTVPAAWSEITIRQLLTHTAGLARQEPESFTNYELDSLAGKSEDEKLAILESFPLAQKAGQGYLYSNLGYDALGFVIAKVTGKHYFAFMQERIFTPLGMTSVRLIKAGNSQQDAVQGYLGKDKLVYPVTFSDGALNGTSLAATGLEMNALDMAKWDNALDGEQLLKKASLAQMWTAQVATETAGQAYGFGWVVQSLSLIHI